jgi:hypothetical protein
VARRLNCVVSVNDTTRGGELPDSLADIYCGEGNVTFTIQLTNDPEDWVSLTMPIDELLAEIGRAAKKNIDELME